MGDRHPQYENRTEYAFHPVHVATLRYIFALADQGNGAMTICKILNADLDRYPNFDRRTGDLRPERSEWNEKTIGRLLRDRACIGEWQPHQIIDGKRTKKGTYPGHYPAAIDPIVFRRVQDRLTLRHRGGGGRGESFRNIVLGLGHCGDPGCGGKLCLTKGWSDWYLRCSRSRRSTCSQHGFPYSIFEPALLGSIGVGIEHMIANLIPTDQPDYRAQIAALETDIAKKNTAMERLFGKYVGHGSDAARAAAEREIDLLGKDIDAMRGDLDRLRDRAAVAGTRSSISRVLSIV